MRLRRQSSTEIKIITSCDYNYDNVMMLIAEMMTMMVVVVMMIMVYIMKTYIVKIEIS